MAAEAMMAVPRADAVLRNDAGEGGTAEAEALAALAALGQGTRLAIFRLLVRMEPNGLSAGAIALEVGASAPTLSSHLGILSRAGLVRGVRDGRSIIYRADLAGMRGLVDFLLDDCCDGRPEVCGIGRRPHRDCGCPTKTAEPGDAP